MNVYSYSGNNPIRYIDPDGNATRLNGSEQSQMILYRAQEKVIKDPEYAQGGEGHYKATNPNNTWCNQALFDIIIATGGDLSKFVNERGRDYTNANSCIEVMHEQASQGNLTMVDGRTAQDLANHGYTVIAGEKGLNGRRGHVASVTINPGYNPSKGPMVAHVGAGKNDLMYASDAFNNLENVEYFVDLKQKPE